MPDESSQTIDFVMLCPSVNTHSSLLWHGMETTFPRLADRTSDSNVCIQTFHSSRSKPRILLVCGHCPAKLPLDIHLRLQPDCMHSFLPSRRSGRLPLGEGRLNGKEEALTVCLGLQSARKANYGGGSFLETVIGGWGALSSLPSTIFLLQCI